MNGSTREGGASPEALPPRQHKRYLGLSIVVDYDAKRCIHAAECIRGLPVVFDTDRRPWILPDAGDADSVATVVERCPSGALHYVRCHDGAVEEPPRENSIVPQPQGPLYVRGRLELRASNGVVLAEDTRMALCRCGQSRNKPFCDNSHRAIGFSDPGDVAAGSAAPGGPPTLTITATENGPLLAEGALILETAGGAKRHLTASVELCRCGASRNKPFCDGSHERVGFRDR